MTDATITSGTPIDIEATVAAAVAKEIAKLKADETAWVTKVKAFVAAHYSKVVAVIGGWATAHFGIVEMLWKLI